MSELQKQAMQYIVDMPEETLEALIQIMALLHQPDANTVYKKISVSEPSRKRIGLAAGRNLYAPDYDLDEYNEEIARLFGVE